MITITEISILLPVYNNCCTILVQEIVRQASAIPQLTYEILVADDGSTNNDVKVINRQLNKQPHCCYIECPDNRGRAAIRNFLARKAQYSHLIFLDSDVTIGSSQWLYNYLIQTKADVVYGGTAVPTAPQYKYNLRYRYERLGAQQHTVFYRQQTPYQSFCTPNFMIRRQYMLHLPFCEEIKTYGYEDTLFGKDLQHAHISLQHIDNPVWLTTFEDNIHFLNKTEEALQTLYSLGNRLEGYSSLLRLSNTLKRYHLAGTIRYFHQLFGTAEYYFLARIYPALWMFKLYKLGYFMSIRKSRLAIYA